MTKKRCMNIISMMSLVLILLATTNFCAYAVGGHTKQFDKTGIIVFQEDGSIIIQYEDNGDDDIIPADDAKSVLEEYPELDGEYVYIVVENKWGCKTFFLMEEDYSPITAIKTCSPATSESGK